MEMKVSHKIIKADIIDLTFTREYVSKTKDTYIDRCCLDLSDSTYPFYLSIIQESHYNSDIYEVAVQNPLTGNLMYNHPLAVHLQNETNSDAPAAAGAPATAASAAATVFATVFTVV